MGKKLELHNDIPEIELIQRALGLSREDSEALLAHAKEVPTTDVIPLEALKRNAAVDSTTNTLNNLHEKNPSAILDRNARA